jgi:hypothetical protein
VVECGANTRAFELGQILWNEVENGNEYEIWNLEHTCTYAHVQDRFGEMGREYGDWIKLNQDRIQWRIFMNTKINLRVS